MSSEQMKKCLTASKIHVISKKTVIKRIMKQMKRDDYEVQHNSELMDYQQDYFTDIANDAHNLLKVYNSSSRKWTEPIFAEFVPLNQYRKYHHEGLFKMVDDKRVTVVNL